MLHRDLGHTGQSPYLGPLFPAGAPANTAVPKWNGVSKVKSSPSIGVDGTIYAAVGWSLCAINPDMSPKWCKRLHGDVSPSSPAIDADGNIWVGDRGNAMNAVRPDGASFKCYYKNGTEGDVKTSPVIGPDGTVYFAFTQNYHGFGVVAALTQNCTLKWDYTIGQSVSTSSPALRDAECDPPDPPRTCPVIYLGSVDGVLHAFKDNGTSVKPLWDTKLGAQISASPVIAPDGSALYVGSTTGLSAVDPATGAPIGTFATNGTFATLGMVDQTAALAADGTIYFGSKSAKKKTFYALNPDGTLKWSSGPIMAENDNGAFPIVGADGVVYAGIGTSMYAFSPDDGTVLWTFKTKGSMMSFPAIGRADGGNAVLYVPSGDSFIYALSSAR